MNLPSAPGAVAVDADGAVVTLERRGVRAVDRTGRTRWETELEGAGLDWPIIDGDLVLVPANGATGGRCVALDRVSGRERWAVDTGPGEIAAVAVEADVAVCASTTGRIVAIDPAAGTTRWSVDLAQYTSGRPVALSPRGALAIDRAAGVVALVVAVERTWVLTSLDLASGAQENGVPLGSAAPPSAVATDGAGTFVVGDGSDRGVLIVDLARQQVQGVPTRDAFDPASIPFVADGVAVVVDRGGGLTAVDLASGKLRWRAELGSPALDTRPALVGGTLVLTDWTRELHAFGWADGRPAPLPLETPGVVAAGADPERGLLVAAGRGGTGNRLDGLGPSEPARGRPLQCRSEPGQSSGQPARP